MSTFSTLLLDAVKRDQGFFKEFEEVHNLLKAKTDGGNERTTGPLSSAFKKKKMSVLIELKNDNRF